MRLHSSAIPGSPNSRESDFLFGKGYSKSFYTEKVGNLELKKDQFLEQGVQMADSIDILLKTMEQSWSQARQAEDQRAFLTNLIVLISAAIYGVLTQTGFATKALPLTLALLILGLYGAIASEKFYERYRHHIYRAGAIRRRLEELYPDSQIEKLINKADQEHASRYPILTKKVHLHSLWLALHLLIALSGLIYTIMILS